MVLSKIWKRILTSVETKLRENFGDNILSAEMMRDFPVFTIQRDKIVEVIKYLYDEPEMEFRFLTDLCGIHFPDNKGQELGVIYHLHNMQKNWRIRLRIFFSVDDASSSNCSQRYFRRLTGWKGKPMISSELCLKVTQI